ncbi:hypothetical protein USDA257_p00910 (plasmid) [Sinorhizobium fredii USDA 257]|uniref:Uncharacterized protein n=1 Tax=Sinorhizobium fredii (strain USDA 257) TaxID=1185652 RepID=I3XG03_SINF2|nr:hypothetical protein USDA257_p00910 [Sinorhizobium fredii USDA 257]
MAPILELKDEPPHDGASCERQQGVRFGLNGRCFASIAPDSPKSPPVQSDQF